MGNSVLVFGSSAHCADPIAVHPHAKQSEAQISHSTTEEEEATARATSEREAAMGLRRVHRRSLQNYVPNG